MPPNPQLAAIEAQLAERFPSRSSIIHPLRQKLAISIYKKERCEALLEEAGQAMRSSAWTLASPTQRQDFRENMRLTRARIEELKQNIRRYLNALKEADKHFPIQNKQEIQ